MRSRILYNRTCAASIKRHYSSQLDTFRANDYCILRDRRKGQKFFIGPLKDEGKLFISKGVVSHKDIISRPPRSIINTHNGKHIYVHFTSYVAWVWNYHGLLISSWPILLRQTFDRLQYSYKLSFEKKNDRQHYSDCPFPNTRWVSHTPLELCHYFRPCKLTLAHV